MPQAQVAASTPSRWWRVAAIGLILLGLLLVGWFGLRAMRSAIRIQQSGLKPGVTDIAAIRGWMTLPYIAKAYRVPEDYLFEQIGLPQAGNRQKSLGQLNREYVPGAPGAVLSAAQAAIMRYQADHPPPTEAVHEQ
jgi:hypothetical protein